MLTFPPSGLGGLSAGKSAIRDVATLAIVAGVQAISHRNEQIPRPKKAPLRASPGCRQSTSGRRARRRSKLTAQTTGSGGAAMCYLICNAIGPIFNLPNGSYDRRPATSRISRRRKKEAVVIKKYANRRLYNTETSTYVTLDDLAAMVRSDRDFVVYDAKTGDDLTHSVLTQIIVEQESRGGGQTLLPVPFLRQLIRFYDDSIGKMVPSYLQFSLRDAGQGAGALPRRSSRRCFAQTRSARAFEAYAGADPQEHGHVRAGDDDVDAVLRRVADAAADSMAKPARPGPPGRRPRRRRRRRRRPDSGCAGIERDLAELQGRARRHAGENREAVAEPRLSPARAGHGRSARA